MVVVVPVEVVDAEAPSILERAEAVRKIRAVLHRLELALREGVVVRDVRPAVCLGDSQVSEQLCYRLATHRRASVSMESKPAGLDMLLFASLENEPPRQRGALSMSEQPANNVAAVDVEDDGQ